MIATTATPTRAMDHHVRARLDAALDRFANDPHPVRWLQLAARQYRRVRRGHERAAWAFEYPRLTDLGLLSNQLRPTSSLPSQGEQEYAKYLAARTLKTAASNQLSYCRTQPKFFVSFMKNLVGGSGDRAEQTGL